MSNSIRLLISILGLFTALSCYIVIETVNNRNYYNHFAVGKLEVRLIDRYDLPLIYNDARFETLVSYPDGGYPYKTNKYVIVFKYNDVSGVELINQITQEAEKQSWQ